MGIDRVKTIQLQSERRCFTHVVAYSIEGFHVVMWDLYFGNETECRNTDENVNEI